MEIRLETRYVDYIPPHVLLSAYASGIFPMSDDRYSDKINWYKPPIRGIIPIENFKISNNVQRKIRNASLTVRFNANFRLTMLACADRPSTWISPLILDSYCKLCELGFAHSVEVYDGASLVGGLYGVSLGGAFFGESMFKYKPDMDKIALYYCHARLRERGFILWDTQYYSPHLATFGAVEIDAPTFQQMLYPALQIEAKFFP